MSEEATKSTRVTELEWLERAVAYYHQRLLETPAAQDYLRSQVVTAAEAATAFRIGFSDGTLEQVLPAVGREALGRVGLLTERGRELTRGCIIFPLLGAEGGTVVGLYGCGIERGRQIYLPESRRGVFNPHGARGASGEVIIATSILDAAALWSLGFRNVVPIYGAGGLTGEIVAHLEECRVRAAALLITSPDAGGQRAEEVITHLSESNIRAWPANLPAESVASFIRGGGEADDLRAILSPPASEIATKPASSPDVEPRADGSIVFIFGDRDYRIKGLTAVGLDRLRVNVRISAEGSFHIDTFDLYQARSRANFAQAAAKLCAVAEQQVARDLLQIIERLEGVRLSMRRAKEEREQKAPMTEVEYEAALALLRDPRLSERIVEDFGRCGLVGERATVLTAYLGAISRKLAEPLGLLIVARSGAGKSALQDALYAFVPPEDAVRVTRLTGQALFYKDPNSLRNKLLMIAEEEGAAQAVYSLRTLASDQRLSIAATRTDPQSGKLRTDHYEVHGPVVIIITTTSPEAFDDETRSRFVTLTMDESAEQTRTILEQQRRRYTLEGVLERTESDAVRRLHHNAQRLLRPLEVVNPYVEALTFPSERLIHRREQKKYLTLINTVALLHQHQREVKRAARGGTEIEYVEVTVEDIALANELAGSVLGQSLDELSPPARSMYREIRALCRRRAEELKCKPREVQLSRREIREATGWSDWQVRTYCRQLVEMEYLNMVSGANGRRYVYELAPDASEEEDGPPLRGLADVKELRRRLPR